VGFPRERRGCANQRLRPIASRSRPTNQRLRGGVQRTGAWIGIYPHGFLKPRNHAVVPELRLDVFPDLRAHVGRPPERPGTSLARDPNRATSTETDMTATAPITTPTENNPWAENLAAQKTRFPNAKDSILFAIAALQDNPDIPIDDLKTLASQQGIRVTAASVNAAKRLLDPENATAPVVAPAGLNPAPRPGTLGEASSGRRSPAGRQRVDPGCGRQDPGAGERRGRTNARGGAEGDHRARSRRRILRYPAHARHSTVSATVCSCSRRAPPRNQRAMWW
jgi:hypothetical protein